MYQVEYIGTSVDPKKLNHAWNCSNIMVAYRASIFQLKARVETQNIGTKNDLHKCRKKNVNNGIKLSI